MAWNREEGSSSEIKFDEGGRSAMFWGLNLEKEELDEVAFRSL